MASWIYRSPKGSELFKVVRLQGEHGGKTFLQQHPLGGGDCCRNGTPTCKPASDGWQWTRGGVKRILYRLDELVKTPLDEPIFIVEGERKADALVALGLTATCGVEGAGRWLLNGYGAALEGRPVVILPDNDKPGERHANDIIGDLSGTASELKCIVLPGLALKADIIDWLAAGGSREELLRLVDAAPVLHEPSKLFPRGVDTRALNATAAGVGAGR